jgi:hypothetical protein
MPKVAVAKVQNWRNLTVYLDATLTVSTFMRAANKNIGVSAGVLWFKFKILRRVIDRPRYMRDGRIKFPILGSLPIKWLHLVHQLSSSNIAKAKKIFNYIL